MDSNGPVTRVNYFSGEALLTQDFQDEQGYHIQARQRLTSGIFTYGVVWGLDVNWNTSQPTQVTVTKGLAVDQEGRQLFVASDQPIVFDGNKLALVDGDENFLIVSYEESASAFSDETGVPGVKRIAENAVIDCVRTYSVGQTRTPTFSVLLAVIEANHGKIQKVTYGNGTYRRGLVALGGALELVPAGEPTNGQNSDADKRNLVIHGPSTEFDGPITIDGLVTARTGVVVGDDPALASLQVCPCELEGVGTLSSSGMVVTVSEAPTPFFAVGDILLVDVGGTTESRKIVKVDVDSKTVTVDTDFTSPLSSSAYTFIRSKVAYIEWDQGNGALQVGVDGTVGIGVQNPHGEYPFTIDRSGMVGIALGTASAQAALDVGGDLRVQTQLNVGVGQGTSPALNVIGDAQVSGNLSVVGNLSYKSTAVTGDLTVSGNVTATTFYGDGSNLTFHSMAGQWQPGVDNSIHYLNGNVGIGDAAPSAPLTVAGGGVSRIGTGLISLIDKEQLAGFQTRLSDEVQPGDLITVGVVLQQKAKIHQVDKANMTLTLEDPFPLSLGPSTYEYQHEDESLKQGDGTIVCEGTQVTGTGTDATFNLLESGDLLVIDQFIPNAKVEIATVASIEGDHAMTLSRPLKSDAKDVSFMHARAGATQRGQGTISSSGVAVTGAGTRFTDLAVGDSLYIESAQAIPAMQSWRVKSVNPDGTLTLLKPAGAPAQSFDANLSAFSHTPSLLMKVGVRSGQPPLQMKSTPLPSALTVCVNGDTAPAPNTVAVNLGEGDVDNTYALQVSGVATMSALSISDDGSQPSLLTVNDNRGQPLLAITPKGVQMSDLQLGIDADGVALFAVTPTDVRIGGVVVGADGSMQCFGQRGPKTYGLGDFTNDTTLTSGTPVLTDGFLTCTVGASGYHDDPYYSVLEATVSGATGEPITGKATGVTVQLAPPSGKYYGVPGTFTMPVRKGETWTVTHTIDSADNIKAAPVVSVVWTPFGPALPKAGP